MLPILLLVLSGVAAKWLFDPDLRLLAKVNLYVLSPALVFTCLANSKASSRLLLLLGAATLLHTFSLTGLATLWSKYRHYSRAEQSGFYLAAVFANTGNFGLPVTLAALGARGTDTAIAIIVVQQVLMFTLGVYLAGRSSMTVKKSLLSILRMPSVYAAGLAVLHRQGLVVVDGPVLQVASVLTQTAIPLFLILLGAQVSSHKFAWTNRTVFAAGAFRLLLAPIVATIIALVLRLDTFSVKVFALEAAMPTAVITTMLAVEYNSSPTMVSCVTLLTTVASVFTLPILLLLF